MWFLGTHAVYGAEHVSENNPRRRMAAPVALPSLVQKSSMLGSSETDVSELMVAPNSSPFQVVVMTATPVGNVPITDRKRLGSMVCVFISPQLPRRWVAEQP
jgi:hypothetical protein